MKSGTGKIISILSFSFIIWVPVLCQISPGELAKVHSHLEGMSNCTQCHILGEKVSNKKCLDCHTELKARIDLQKGYHSSVEVRGKECVKCHSDHHGKNFQILRFDKGKFNHNLTGFNLLGAHAKKQCINCHKAEFIKDQKIKKKKFTYLGLSPECLTCHKDYHQNTLSANCSNCHDFEMFKPAKNFDHKNAKFQLTGKHMEVACIACHKVSTLNGQKFQEFKGVKFDNCSNCHTDPHANKFGQNCSQCHSDQSFSMIKPVNNFDHNKTDFKLVGKHQNVECKLCHKTKYTNALKFGRCTDCHTDYHVGQFAKEGVSPDCSACHTVYGFIESSFTIEQHNLANFRLEGAHVATPCIACHKKETKWSFRNIGKRCSDCHADIHKTFISEKYYPETNCKSCHNENRWSEINFNHSKTNFDLVGAHTKKTCRDCHFKKDKEGVVRQQFMGLAYNCASCHKDVHVKQFEANGITDCNRCHGSDSFKPAIKFDHSKTLFPLDGKHIKVACIKCHKEIKDQEQTFVLYKIKEFKCADCHH
jgi:nitrate/TMAO reductase-like tetraheme cytochrome c subunit